MKFTEVSKGITHFEDLQITEIIETLTNFQNYQITEKVDGAQILFGIDEQGFYTSRETKGGTRIYSEGDYGVTFSSTYMRSAHRLLENVLRELKDAGLRTGDQVEAEVLYGALPNVVPYSEDTSYLIFLRTTEGTVNIDRLHKKLDGKSVSVPLVAPYTKDGRSIELREEVSNWQFARVPIIERSLPVSQINRRVAAMSKYLGTTDAYTLQTFGSLLETPLNKIPDWVTPGTWKHVKEYIKERRDEIRDELEREHIFPAKDILLNHLVRNTSSKFGPLLEHGGWIEGVVLRHKSTGKMVKLVDKSVFGAVREQAWQKRNMLSEAAKSTENPTSFMGRLLIDMATSIGHPELGTIQAKGYLRKCEYITEGIDVESVKDYWSSLLIIRESELEADLDKYEKEESIDTAGPGRHLAGAVKERTRQAFAQIFGKISKLKEYTTQATTPGDLVSCLAGKQLDELDMRLDEAVSLNDVLKADSFIQLLDMIKTKPIDLNVTRIKNQVLQSWKKGMRSRKHYDTLLSQIDISLSKLIKK